MILLVGPSASGKTEIGKCLETKYGFKKVVTYTTRLKRLNEVDDIDYHFISKELFLKFKESNLFFETMYYNENFYGTALKDFKDNSYLIVDPKGLKVYKESHNKVIAFYLLTDLKVRKERMMARGDDIQDIFNRLKSDDDYFDVHKIPQIDYVIDTNEKSIIELTDKIFNIYENANKK